MSDSSSCNCDKSNSSLSQKDSLQDNEVKGSDMSDKLQNCDEDLSCNEFLEKYLKAPLVKGLRNIILKNPSDSIEYLANWLLHYRDCKQKKEELKKFEADLFLYRKDLEMLDNADSDDLWTYLNQEEDTSEKDSNN